MTIIPREEKIMEIKKNKCVTKAQGTYLSQNTHDEMNE